MQDQPHADVDLPRARISLTLRLDDEADRRKPDEGRRDGGGRRQGGGRQGGGRNGGGRQGRGGSGGSGGGALADALRRAGLDKGLPGQ
ncbi:hypothetical protein [Actinoallomurus iriomotensis]|uniref:hypothetical protein n=1 Tax=Actinoallomurus iriomotensis TaxID=478107 RepID=UPI0025530466|nr:hypothetical protein [Actinoallomurus iriomotensis]